jgi:patatin-like phospholipase
MTIVRDTPARRDLAITLAGGGNRAFYQLGLLNRWCEMLHSRIAGIAACSAGAAVIITYLADRQAETHDYWVSRCTGITTNFDWRRLLAGQRPSPAYPIYRDTLLHALAAGGWERVRSQPFPILVLAARLPRFLPAALAVPLGISGYSIEKRLRTQMVHPSFGRLLGFAPTVVDARACESPEELAALILASSATPPFTPVGAFRGHRLLDGGMVDNVPAFVGDAIDGATRNLVLLTRPYPPTVTGPRGTRLYLAPSAPVPIGRWDYTQPGRLRETIAMGEREADLHQPALDRFLA